MFKMALMVLTLVSAAGCATPMALRNPTSCPAMNSGTGLVVMVAETRKADDLGASLGAGAVPTIQSIEIARVGSPEAMAFSVDSELILPSKIALMEKGNVYTHLLSFSLPEGIYEIRKVSGKANYRKGAFAYNPALQISCVGGKAVYGGHLDFRMRRAKEGEQTIGTTTAPIVTVWAENLMIGFNTATFDLTVVDQQENDVKFFREKFPRLEKIEFTKGLARPR